MKWVKIIVNQISDKGFISKYIKLIELNSKSSNNLINKFTKDLNKQFHKETIHISNGYMKDAKYH